MAKLTTKIELTGLQPVQALLEILAAHYDELPTHVQDALQALSEGEALVWDIDYLLSVGADTSSVTVFADGQQIERVVALHPFTREIELIGGLRVKAERAEIRDADGNGIRGWA